jgi:hypothetical protein
VQEYWATQVRLSTSLVASPLFASALK